MSNQNAGWTGKLTPVDEALQPIGHAVERDLGIQQKVYEINASPQVRLSNASQIMQRQIDQIDEDIKKATAEAEYEIDQAVSKDASMADADQDRIDALRAEIAGIETARRERKAETKQAVADLKCQLKEKVDVLNLHKTACNSFLSDASNPVN